MPSPSELFVELPRQVWQAAANLLTSQHLTIPAVLPQGGAVSLGLQCKDEGDLISLLVSAEEGIPLLEHHESVWRCMVTKVADLATGISDDAVSADSLVTKSEQEPAVGQPVVVIGENAVRQPGTVIHVHVGELVEPEDHTLLPVQEVHEDEGSLTSPTINKVSEHLQVSFNTDPAVSISADHKQQASASPDPLAKHRRVCKLCGQASYMESSQRRHISAKHRMTWLQYLREEAIVNVEDILKQFEEARWKHKRRRKRKQLNNLQLDKSDSIDDNEESCDQNVELVASEPENNVPPPADQKSQELNVNNADCVQAKSVNITDHHHDDPGEIDVVKTHQDDSPSSHLESSNVINTGHNDKGSETPRHCMRTRGKRVQVDFSQRKRRTKTATGSEDNEISVTVSADKSPKSEQPSTVDLPLAGKSKTRQMASKGKEVSVDTENTTKTEILEALASDSRTPEVKRRGKTASMEARTRKKKKVPTATLR